jgi:hypothetical protein
MVFLREAATIIAAQAMRWSRRCIRAEIADFYRKALDCVTPPNLRDDDIDFYREQIEHEERVQGCAERPQTSTGRRSTASPLRTCRTTT